MVSFAKKIVVIRCARAVYTARVRVHGPYMAMYTGGTHGPYTAVYMFADTGRVHDSVHGPSCTRHVHGRVHGPTRPVRGRVHEPTQPCRRPCTRRYNGRVITAVYMAVYGLCKRTGRVGGRIHGPCTRTVHGRIHGPCAGVHVYTAITPPCTRRARDVHTAVTQLRTGRVHGRVHGTRPCTRPVHAVYMAV